MNKSIINLEDLKKIRKKYKNKKIILVHGVFDLIHPGHLSYFEEAKSYGDILVASLTADKFVKKGFNKPYFQEKERSKFLSHINMVDYVFVNNAISAVPIIKNLKPDFYVKGPDYVKKNGDVAGNLNNEKKETIKMGGSLVTTTGKLYSSTKLLNLNFKNFNPATEILSSYSDKYKKYLFQDYFKTLKKIKKDKILIMGEIIIDDYIVTDPLGKPSKEDILSVCYSNKRSYHGGVIPVVKNISQICDNVEMLTIYNNESLKKRIINNLDTKVKKNFIRVDQYEDIVKSRYLNRNNNKIFEVYKMKKKIYDLSKVYKFLIKKLSKYDHVIVCDFGHGLIDNKIIKLLTNKSKFLSLNIQTNSGNRGFNLFKKFHKSDFLCIDEGEMRLGLSDEYSNYLNLVNNKVLKNFKNIMLTLGTEGHHLKIIRNKHLKFPALNTKALDTIGAGDALFSFSSCFLKNSKNIDLISFVSTIAGAIKANIIGHQSNVNINEIEDSLRTLLK